MRLIIPLILIAFASTLQAQDVIEWSDKRKLTFADFKNVPEMKVAAERIILRYGTQNNLDSTQLSILKSFNGEITALFYPNDSWIDESNKTGLQYANTLFDIQEWACRELRKRLSENRELILPGTIKDIVTELEKEFTTILEAYDTETEYASNMIEQMKWESRISQQLLALSIWCKNCEALKINN